MSKKQTNDIVIEVEKPKTSKKRLFVLGGIVVVILVVISIIFLGVMKNSTKNTNSTGIGEPNLDIIFDETTPMPLKKGNYYGYMNPTDGSWILELLTVAPAGFMVITLWLIYHRLELKNLQ